MKTMTHLRQCFGTTLLALAVLGVLPLLNPALAQEKGATLLQRLHTVTTVQDLQALNTDDTIVMSCPKCKDTWISVVEKTFKSATPQELKSEEIHLCPACSTRLVTKGQGKHAQDVLVHTCKMCGSKDVFCCVMTKNGHPSPGMEQK